MTEECITPLRRRMIEDMSIRHFASKTQHDYIRTVMKLTRFLGRSPDAATRPSQKSALDSVVLGFPASTAIRRVQSSVATPVLPKRTAAFPVRRRAHADLCVNLPGCPQTTRGQVPRWPSIPRGEHHSRL
jgi:hypothetical protein